METISTYANLLAGDQKKRVLAMQSLLMGC